MAGAVISPVSLLAAASAPDTEMCNSGKTAARWGKGIEGQRRTDLGDGTYLNPHVAGADPKYGHWVYANTTTIITFTFLPQHITNLGLSMEPGR